MHANPSDALAIHKVLRSEKSVGIHWGTFTTLGHSWEISRWFRRVMKEEEVGGSWEKAGFVLVDVGKWLDLD
jgi:N-acyl-phosphatidylethanolamine-hydrolysing phospholipase D